MLAWDWRTVTHRHLREGSFERMGMLGSVTYCWEETQLELLNILSRYHPWLFLSKIWDKMFSTTHKSRFCCSWGDARWQKESTGLQQAYSRCCLRELPVSDHWARFCCRSNSLENVAGRSYTHSSHILIHTCYFASAGLYKPNRIFYHIAIMYLLLTLSAQWFQNTL